MSEKPADFIKREGKMILQGHHNGNEEDFSERVLAAEQYLNGEVTTEVFRRFKLGLRVHS